ncbi:TVP38/TMEM64 family protein [Clostridioides mangenotii]|uniref:TVP38/TMEM64 family protein n=1 Tax=Metaclostridioides mangenotii TaxID=1540 RepID=UPI001C0F84B9|nr:TVP38/TMEM64 family protein [Clostridioides mangenotii]MBU5306312.1 TVP38/TMEM64 family protein [Clostridioides mangenotii]
MKKKNKAKLIIVGIILILLLIYLFVPSVKNQINEVVYILSSMNLDGVIEYIRSFGAWAVVISFSLMIFQSIAAPIPAFLITFANAAIFGWWQGAILSWTSAMAGAALCFFIANILGRDVAEKLTSKTALESIDVFFEKYGKHTILICRLLPFMSFDIVSYAAGLTSMSFMSFIVATGIGQLPATLIYSYVGGMLTGGAKKFVMGLLILFAVSVLIFMIKKIFNDKKKVQDSTQE